MSRVARGPAARAGAARSRAGPGRRAARAHAHKRGTQKPAQKKPIARERTHKILYTGSPPGRNACTHINNGKRLIKQLQTQQNKKKQLWLNSSSLPQYDVFVIYLLLADNARMWHATVVWN